MSIRSTVELKERITHQYQGARAEEIDIFNCAVRFKCGGNVRGVTAKINMSESTYSTIEMSLDWAAESPYAIY